MVEALARWAGRRLVYRAPNEADRCPACGSPRLEALALHKLERAIRHRKTALVSGCEECGLVFVNPPPSDEDLAAMYAPTGGWASHRSEPIETAVDEPRKPGAGLWRHMFDGAGDALDVTHPAAGSRVLDFGCGRGKFLDVLQACGWDTFGIEPASEAAFARHHRLTGIPPEPTFDLIIAHHVLEHVARPLALLQQFAAAARPGAHLLVAVPRLDTLPTHRDYSYVTSRVHITSYTAACMRTLLAEAGWEALGSPDDEVKIAGGRRTTARLRMLARRAVDAPPRPARPLDAARRALRAHARQQGGAALTAPPFVRLSARIIESRRWFRRRVGVRLQHMSRSEKTL